MKTKDLKQKSKEELLTLLDSTKKNLIQAKVKVATGGDVKQVSKIREIRRDVARINTLLNQKN